jgi:cytoskeletal protein CcmA (bactofilin family)
MGKWRLRSADGGDDSEIVSFVGEGTLLTGDLEFKGGARLDGKVVGRITANSLVVVGPTGDIDAQELRAPRVTVCGTVRGTLVVQERLEIQPGGSVIGHIVMEKPGLVVAPGGSFEGAVEYLRSAEPEPITAPEFAEATA